MMMNVSFPTMTLIGVLSLAVWVAFYVATPADPLQPAETLVVVLGVAGAVVATGSAYRALRARRGAPPVENRSRARSK